MEKHGVTPPDNYLPEKDKGETKQAEEKKPADERRPRCGDDTLSKMAEAAADRPAK